MEIRTIEGQGEAEELSHPTKPLILENFLVSATGSFIPPQDAQPKDQDTGESEASIHTE